MTLSGHEGIVLYDGVCRFCHGLVSFLLARDRQEKLAFSPLQSETARAILRRHGRTPEEVETFFLLLDPGGSDERLLDRSDAALASALMLGPPWAFIGRVAAALPKALRDAVYDIVARIRYRLPGKRDECPVPPPESANRFLLD